MVRPSWFLKKTGRTDTFIGSQECWNEFVNICKLVNILRAIKCNFLKSFLPPGRNQLQNKVYLYLYGHESFALPSFFYNLQNCKVALSNTAKGTGPYRIRYSQKSCQTLPSSPLEWQPVILLSISKLFTTFSDTSLPF